MKFNWLALIEGILGVGAQVVPIFIHNPQSQKVEAVVLSTLPGIEQVLSQAQANPTPAATKTAA